MPRDATYYLDYIIVDGGWAYRWMMIPASRFPYTSLLEPPFVTDPEEGSTWVRIPEDCIGPAPKNKNPVSPIRYDSFPIGMADSAQYNRIAVITELTGLSEALEDLKVYLKEPEPESAVLNTIAPSVPFRLANQWILKRALIESIDEITGEIAITDWQTVFHGVQSGGGKISWDIATFRTSRFQFPITDIREYLLKRVPVEWVNRRFNEFGDIPYTAQLLHQHFWRDEATSQKNGAQITMPAEYGKFVFEMGRWSEWYQAMEVVINEAYQYLTRQEVTTATRNLRLRSTLTDGAEDPAGMPRDIVGLFELDYTRDCLHGAELSRDDHLFVAHTTEVASDTWVAGVCTDKEGSINDYPSLYDFLHEECKTFGARAQYVIVDEYNSEIWFYGAAEAQRTVDVSPEHWSIGNDGKGLEQGEYGLKAVKIQRPYTGELEEGNILVENWQLAEGGKEYGFKGTQCTVPAIVGGAKDAKYKITGAGGGFPDGYALVESGVGASIYRMTFYAKEAADIHASGSGTMIIRAHHDLRIYDVPGGAYTDYTYAIPAPMPMIPSGADADVISQIRARNVLIHQNAGLLHFVGRSIMETWGDMRNALCSLIIGRDYVDMSNLGDIFRLNPPNDDDEYNGRPLLLLDDDVLDDVPGIGYAVSVEPDSDYGQSLVVILLTRHT